MSRSNVDISSFIPTTAGLGGILRYWWLPPLTLMIALAVTGVFTWRQPRVYRASTSIVVCPNPKITNAREVTEVYNTLDRRSVMATLAKTPVTGAIKERVAAELGMPQDAYEVSSVVVPDTNILEITVDGPEPEAVRAVANTTAKQTGIYSAGFYDTFELRTLDPAREARLIRPAPARNFAVGGVLGLTVGFAFALLAGYLGSARDPQV